MQQKPELLLPAGNTESFFAALEAGADAVYLGLDQFNARGRANNFNRFQLVSVINEASKRKVKVYVTLNTVIKNKEIPQLIEYLHYLNELKVDGIIIQDWGVYWLASKYFQKLKIHASTQLGIHNSQGIQFLQQKNFTRSVLARELTLKELEKIARKADIETEVFVHGALCYSFSGMCLFSSYTGGRGANRGICAQSCRREYEIKGTHKYLFNLKDNQLIDFLPRLAEIGVTSLKVEGRLKSAEYVYRVGSAYRLALDGNTGDKLAKQMLELDFGRSKTSWFAGGNVKDAVSQEASTGILLGKVIKSERNFLIISSDREIKTKFRLRLVAPENTEPVNLVVNSVRKEGNCYWIEPGNNQAKHNSLVYLTKLQDRKFPDRLETNAQFQIKPLNPATKQQIQSDLKSVKAESKKENLWFRIGSPDWLQLINFSELDGLIISFTKPVLSKFDFSQESLLKNSDKIYFEFPKFIAENSLSFYKTLIDSMVKLGFSRFVISHLSQKTMIPDGCQIITNENVYVFNDASAKLIQSEGIQHFIYPFEIDFETLESLNHKNGIVPLYFFPELFYSRMPVQLESEGQFSGDENKTKYNRYRKNGVTIVVPDRAVSILQHKNRLVQNGFTNFLIDVTYDTLSKNRLKTLKTRFLKSEQIQPSTTFNFTKGLV